MKFEINMETEIVVYETRNNNHIFPLFTDFSVRVGNNIINNYDLGQTIYKTNFGVQGLMYQDIAETQANIVARAIYRLKELVESLNLDKVVISYDFPSFYLNRAFVSKQHTKTTEEWIDDLYLDILMNANDEQLDVEYMVETLIRQFKKQ